MPSDHDGSLDAAKEGRCPECSGRLFEIIPHQTSWKAIEELLLEYATTDVVQALMSTTVTPAVAEGAARHFGGWEFRGHRKEELNLVPTELKKQLLKHALEHSDRENSGDAMSAFGDVLD